MREQKIPRRNGELISATAREIGFDEGPFMEVLRVREGTVKPGRQEMERIVEKYLGTIRDLWKTVDQLEVKEGQV